MQTDVTGIDARLHARLEELSHNAAASYGGKAAMLGVLMNSEVRVPEGLAFSSRLYRSFLEHNRFPYERHQYVSHNDEIRRFLLQGTFPSDLQALLRKTHQELTGGGRAHKLAVRSSASCEDRHAHSMAGIFESSIDVATCAELEAAIKKCFASLFSDRALAFMLRQKVALENIEMGIIVQRFVAGAPSGVMFTADTVTMEPDVVVVSAVDGSCAAYVDGSLPSTLYKVHKHTGAIIANHAASSATQLSADALTRLREAAMRIEQAAGKYQDIEWTFSNGELFVLQARPITTFTPRTQELAWPDLAAEGKTWRRDDNCPNPLAPLQQDITMQVYQGVHQGMMITGRGRGFEGRIVHGHAYIHPNGGRPSRRREAYVAKLEVMHAAGNHPFQEDVLPQIMAYTRVLRDYLSRVLNGEELAAFLDTAVEFHGRGPEFHAISIADSAYVQAFQAYCQGKCPGLTAQDVYDLVYQVTWLTRDREAVLRMAAHVRARPALLALFETQPYDEILFARLSRSVEGRELADRIERYLEDFGLFPQAKEGAVIAPPVLMEEPAAVISRIRACLNVDGEIFFRSQAATLAHQQVVLATLLATLPETEHQEFRLKLKAARKAFLAEDDHCYYLDMSSEGYSRMAIVKAGERLTADGVIAAAEDVFFLTVDEIKEALTAGTRDVRQITGERRALQAQQKLLAAPEILGKAPDKQQAAAGHPHDQADEAGGAQPSTALTGIPGCRKSIRGVVRVISEAFRPAEITEPRILVMPHAHGQYLLPVLGKIQGLIFDEGSPFDHAGIIVRELEIPSVYQTKNATRMLRDDDVVEIDGANGRVSIHR